ncbi:MAG: sigma-70 family RNA polymerase sigma factor [Chitinispirillia bacterium]|jgi:RNA polymerase sigma-70 factor (ECF subfamily)
MDSDSLISGCLGGDKQAQRVLFKKYREKIYNIISHSLGPNFEKDDIFQEAFIKVFKSLKKFKGISSLDTWVYRITTKVCIDHIRKKYRKRKIEIVNNSDTIDKLSNTKDNNPDKETVKKELIEQIYYGLDRLSIEKRIVITMFEIEGFPLQDISEILGKPIGTIKSRLFHGRKELAGYLRSYLD